MKRKEFVYIPALNAALNPGLCIMWSLWKVIRIWLDAILNVLAFVSGLQYLPISDTFSDPIHIKVQVILIHYDIIYLAASSSLNIHIH